MKLRITVEGVAYEVEVEVLEDGGTITAPPPIAMHHAPAAAKSTARSAKTAAPPAVRSAGAPGEKNCKAPIAGTIVQLKVKPGDAVAINQVLVVMEAMKMETNIACPVAGKVKNVVVKTGQAVKAGEVLVEFE